MKTILAWIALFSAANALATEPSIVFKDEKCVYETADGAMRIETYKPNPVINPFNERQSISLFDERHFWGRIPLLKEEFQDHYTCGERDPSDENLRCGEIQSEHFRLLRYWVRKERVPFRVLLEFKAEERELELSLVQCR